jgi:hypothetical protein
MTSSEMMAMKRAKLAWSDWKDRVLRQALVQTAVADPVSLLS